MEPLTPNETRKIIDSISKKATTGARNHAILVTLLDTGLRASEVASTTLNNLKLKDGYGKIMGKGAKDRIWQVFCIFQEILIVLDNWNL